MVEDRLRPLEWIGNSKKQLLKFPDYVKRDVGYTLDFAQRGVKHVHAKPLKGIGAGIFEIVTDYKTDTYRAVYAVKIGKTIYVLHAFQKKPRKGIATPKVEIELVRQRYKEAQQMEGNK